MLKVSSGGVFCEQMTRQGPPWEEDELISMDAQGNLQGQWRPWRCIPAYACGSLWYVGCLLVLTRVERLPTVYSPLPPFTKTPAQGE